MCLLCAIWACLVFDADKKLETFLVSAHLFLFPPRTNHFPLPSKASFFTPPPSLPLLSQSTHRPAATDPFLDWHSHSFPLTSPFFCFSAAAAAQISRSILPGCPTTYNQPLAALRGMTRSDFGWFFLPRAKTVAFPYTVGKLFLK